MASSPDKASGFLRCVLLLACALFAAFAAPSAYALEGASIADRPREPVSVVEVYGQALWQPVVPQAFEVEEETSCQVLSVPRLCPVALYARCNPESIDAGVDCGMSWMCGIEPCLCGSADAWGGCSCNGMQTLYPSVRYESDDESVLRVVEGLHGEVWLIPVGRGAATLVCTASLKNYEDTAVSYTVEVGEIGAVDAAFVGLAVLAAALVGGVCVAFAQLARAIGRWRRAARARRAVRARRAAAADEGGALGARSGREGGE